MKQTWITSLWWVSCENQNEYVRGSEAGSGVERIPMKVAVINTLLLPTRHYYILPNNVKL